MLKKVVGAIATLSFMIGTLGMGYPHESESQQENAYLVYSEAVTSRMSEETHSSAQTVSRVQAQGARSIARYAKEEARIQEAAMPLVMNRIEASKRKTSLTEEEIQLLQKVVSAESRGESSETQYTVACVVLNRIEQFLDILICDLHRIESDIFPDTLAEVIVQSGQFACVENGAVYSAPITESVAEAVNKALDNNTVDENVLWFRSGHYHGFHNRAFRLDRMYFSQM